MAQDIQKGETFADGQLVTASRLNNLADLATILEGFISDKSPATGDLSNDYLVVFDPDSNSLKKALFQGGVSSVALTMPTEFTVAGSPVTSTGTFIVTKVNQSGNKIYASPADGTAGVPTFRAANIKDVTFPPLLIAATTIDWSLSNQFYKVVNSATAFSFTNQTEGQTIRVAIARTAGTITWPTVRWFAGVIPIATTTGMAIFEFYRQGGLDFGHAFLDYKLP